MSSKVMKVPDGIYQQVYEICDRYRKARDLKQAQAELQALGVNIAVSLVEPQDTQRAA